MENSKNYENEVLINMNNKIITHLEFLKNKILVFENILENLEENKLPENFLEEVKKENTNLSDFQNYENNYFFYLKNQEKEFEHYNNILSLENEKKLKKFMKSQNLLEDYKSQVTKENDEKNENIKKKKLLADKVK